MLKNLKVKKYERKITPLERMFSRSPFSIVTVVARIKGNISEIMLINAVPKSSRDIQISGFGLKRIMIMIHGLLQLG